MKRRQIVTIAALILLPVAVGFIILANSDGGGVGFQKGSQIGLVRVQGIIYDSEEYVRQLKELREDITVAGIIVRVDSPGGAVAPSQEIYAEIIRCRNLHKPVVVSMGNVAASGGYYIASPATRIFANPGTLTGSIGVVFTFPQYHQLLDKLGVSIQTLTAGEFKDIGSPSRNMTSDEKKILSELLDDTHQQFIQDISRARNCALDSIRALADGRIYTGRQAYGLGLVDSLGGFEEAIGYLKRHLRLPEKVGIVEKAKRPTFFQSFLPQAILKQISGFKSPLKPAGTYFLFEGL
ncbi:MAG: signal peptide peptidase SppA [Chitinivibrionales bacterium]